MTLELLDRVAATWGAWIVERGVDGALAALVVVPVVLLARRASPHLRSALLLLALVPLVVPLPRLPFAARFATTPALRRSAIKALEALEWVGALASRERAHGTPPNSVTTGGSADAASDVGSPSSRSPAAGSSIHAPTVAFLAWLLVVELLLARWLVHDGRLRRALRSVRPLELGDLSHGVPVVESDAVAAPATIGLWSPTIVLPTRLRAQLSPAGLAFVLRHESAHVRRGDLVVGAIERLVRLVWFFHPAAWIVGRLLDAERERACDDAALAEVPRSTRAECADAFLRTVEFAHAASRGRSDRPAPAVAMSRDGRHVRSRLVRIADADRKIVSGMTRASWAALALCVVAVAVVLQPARATPSSPTRPLQAAPRDPALADAIARGAAWLVKHQEKDGHFSAAEPRHDVGVTGLAALALADAASIAADEATTKALTRSLDWLVAQQDAKSGRIGVGTNPSWIYGHCYATLALVESGERLPSAARHAAAERAIDKLLRARNPYKGWRYGEQPDGDVDASVTALVEIVLGRAVARGFAIDPQAIADGIAVLDALTDLESGRTGYQQRGSPPARTIETMERFPSEMSESTTAVALHARLAHQTKLTDVTRRSVARLGAALPRWSGNDDGHVDLYFWSHGTAALRDVGGEAWKRWRDALSTTLESRQRAEGDDAGSFDPADPWSAQGGRVYSTALAVSALAAAGRD
jgi:beta-lactamase regulating signal transducer with metallopeptidase domain